MVEIDDLAVEAELVKVTAGRLKSASGIEASSLQRVETGTPDQTLDRRRGNVVVGIFPIG